MIKSIELNSDYFIFIVWTKRNDKFYIIDVFNNESEAILRSEVLNGYSPYPVYYRAINIGFFFNNLFPEVFQ